MARCIKLRRKWVWKFKRKGSVCVCVKLNQEIWREKKSSVLISIKATDSWNVKRWSSCGAGTSSCWRKTPEPDIFPDGSHQPNHRDKLGPPSPVATSLYGDTDPPVRTSARWHHKKLSVREEGDEEPHIPTCHLEMPPLRDSPGRFVCIWRKQQ